MTIWIFALVKSITAQALRKKLGQRVKEIRRKQKISQKQLAFESGLSREVVYRLELGTQNVAVDTLLSIAKALDVHVKEFYDFDY